MPKSITITKDMIDNAAFELGRKKGIESLSARNIAKSLRCSTQPIYNTYENMDEIKAITMAKLEQFVMGGVMTYKKTGRPFLDAGLGYINFAKTEKVLFRDFELQISSTSGTECETGNPKIRALMEVDECIQEYNLTKEDKDEAFKKIMIFTYGVAVLSYLDKLRISEEEIAIMLEAACDSYLEQEISKRKVKETK